MAEGKRKRLSFSLKWKIAVSDKKEIEKAKKPVVPKNTQKATDWAVGVFKQWLENHNAVDEKKCPTEILDDVDENLCHWLCVFVSEILKDNGEEYTPKAI